MSMIMSWIKWLFTLFQKPQLPHPEEPPNYNQTMLTASIDDAFEKWFTQWDVPIKYRDYWRNAIVITLDGLLNYPAGTWRGIDGKRYLAVRPEWLNAGVIAHEQAHNSYALLTDTQKNNFAVEHESLKSSGLIKLLYSKNAYGLTNPVEGHAEVYRYIGEQMPEVLKQYYPQLFV